MLDRAAAQAVVDQYPEMPLIDREHVLRRLQRCQYDEIAARIPSEGTVLDIGCGHGHFGVYLSLHRPGIGVIGCDPDERKIAAAQASLPAGEGGPCRFHVGDCTERDDLPEAFAGIVMIDILYLMPPADQERLLDWALARLADGGAIVIKTIDPDAGFRSTLAVLQEWVMVRLLRRTRSSGAFAAGQSLSWYLERLEGREIETECIPLSKNKTPSALVIGLRRDRAGR